MKAYRNEGEVKKKQSIINLLNKTMSQHKKAFLSWSYLVSEEKCFKKCKMVSVVYDDLDSILKRNFFGFFQTNFTQSYQKGLNIL
jgi:hypothetical protein